MKKTKQFFLVLFIGILVVLFFYKKETETSTYQSIAKKQNSCISCHTEMQGFSPAHTPDKISCSTCHLGNSLEFDKEKAHNNILLVPGNLSNASETCAKCHVGIDLRVKNSIMNTMSGIISVDKYVFGENKKLDSLFNIHHLKNSTAAEKHLRNKCASCHIGNEKSHPNPITEKSRGGGCLACHLNYSEKGKEAHKKYISSNKTQKTNYHPSLSLKVTDNHCFGCHSRSGRVATNYEGWHETIYKDTLYGKINYRVLEDKRVFEKQEADVHHTIGMSCIDCHDSYEVMGDGTKYAHQEEAVKVRCTDCHNRRNIKTETIKFSELEISEQRIIRLKKLDTTAKYLKTKKSKRTLLNVIREKEQNYLITKNTSKKIELSKQATDCSREVHKNVSCSTCHTSWAPQCISCHTTFDKNEDGYDLLAKDWKMGKWTEKGSDYLAEYPTLGIVDKEGEKTIKTFSPGMIMSLQQTEKMKQTFHRLYAPVSAHTISAKGKTCTECHNNPVVLGYGRGELIFTKKGIWQFKPKYPKSEDGLPQDAWIPFLTTDTINKATRTTARPFILKEQQKILRVGACLTCHTAKSKEVKTMLKDFQKALDKRSDKCISPKF